MPARVLATGLDAVSVAGSLIGSAVPIQQGSLTIPVGTIDQKQSIFIVGKVGWKVVYLRDNTLSEQDTQGFLHGYMIGEVVTTVYQRTAWIVPASKIMVSFITGVTIGYVGAAAVAANIVLTMIRIGVTISTHPREVEQVNLHLPQILRTVAWLQKECPVLSSKLRRLVLSGVWEAICSAPSGISAEDVAAVLGRMLGGVTAVSEVAETGLMAVAKVVVCALLAYSVLHLPVLAVNGSVEGADELAKALADELRAQRVALTPQEEAAIAAELAKSTKALSQLQELQTALSALAPAIDTLFSDFAKGTAE